MSSNSLKRVLVSGAKAFVAGGLGAVATQFAGRANLETTEGIALAVAVSLVKMLMKVADVYLDNAAKNG